MRTPPRVLRDGEVACLINPALLEGRAELALTIALVCNRRLFGLCYRGLLPDYFEAMPKDSGVLACPIVPTGDVVPGAERPGDIDLLVVPYEGNDLILGRALAIEVKAVRATYLRQGRSPNDYGFSQARGLTALGFPHVGLAHLIVSDASPPRSWRAMKAVQVLDEEGRTTAPFDVTMDMLAVDLVERAFGRLQANTTQPGLGLVAAYLDGDEFSAEGRAGGPRLWVPRTRPAHLNPAVDPLMLQRVGELYERHSAHFIPIPRY